MNLYLANTDYDWFTYLKGINPEDVNFWQPSGKSFKAIEPGSPFVLKLKYPHNAVAGFGFYAGHSVLPLSYAWESFKDRNGSNNYHFLKERINKYRKLQEHDPLIGCIILTSPIFFDKSDWFEPPVDWKKNIVTGKTYSTETVTGKSLWNKVFETAEKYYVTTANGASIIAEANRYSLTHTKVRLGQGAFRVLVTDAYNRRCSITGEKTLPVLEAAHIKSYSESGPHAINNGLLLRSDFHKLYDTGYVTVTRDYSLEVSKHLKEDYHNGKVYYKHHGQKILLPADVMHYPDREYLNWHNEHIYKG